MDGKPLLIFKCKLYTKGSRDYGHMKRSLVYWIERIIRENNDDMFTPVFDLSDCGLSNIDLDYTRYIINIFKNHYPDQINYILVYDMAWILNGKDYH